MNPFKICVGGDTIYSSNHKSPASSRNATPPDSVSAKKLPNASAAAFEYFASPVSACARTSNEIPCPCASPEYQGAFSVLRYSQSK